MYVTSVFFVKSCAQTGYWQINAEISTGYSNVVKSGVTRGCNSIYVPRAALLTDFSYSYDYLFAPKLPAGVLAESVLPAHSNQQWAQKNPTLKHATSMSATWSIMI